MRRETANISGQGPLIAIRKETKEPSWAAERDGRVDVAKCRAGRYAQHVQNALVQFVHFLPLCHIFSSDTFCIGIPSYKISPCFLNCGFPSSIVNKALDNITSISHTSALTQEQNKDGVTFHPTSFWIHHLQSDSTTTSLPLSSPYTILQGQFIWHRPGALFCFHQLLHITFPDQHLKQHLSFPFPSHNPTSPSFHMNQRFTCTCFY